MSSEFRHEAEELFHKHPEDYELPSDIDMNATLKELRIRQIALELQNQALRSAQDEVERTRRKFVDFFNRAPVGYVILNRDGIICEVNVIAASLLGNTPDNLIHRELRQFFASEYREAFSEYLEEVYCCERTISDELHIYDEEMERALPVYVEGTMLDQQQHAGHCMIALIDITTRKELEQERIRVAVEREKVNILADFVKDASHEFRTPLSMITLAVHFLRKMPKPMHDEQYNLIEDSVAKLLHLLNSMLEIINLSTTSQLKQSPIDLSMLVRNAVGQLQYHFQLHEHQVKVNFDDRIVIQGNERWLSRAVSELLFNAINFTPTGGEIHVSTEAYDDCVLLVIEDNGMGIAPEHLESVRQLFFRQDSARTERGFGLGLYIADKVTHLHNGTLKLESRPQQGTRVTMIFPHG